MRKKVTFKGGHIIVRESTGQDELIAQLIATQLMTGYAPDAQGFWQHFGELCSQTVESEGLPFKPETVAAAGPLDKRAAYDAYLRVPTAIRRQWSKAAKALNEDGTVAIEDVAADPNP